MIDAQRHHHRAGPRRLPSPFLGRAASPHQSELADARRLYERDASFLRQGLPAAGSLCRQLPHRDRLHRCRHHLRDRQFAQFAQRRPFRCGGRGAVRLRHPRRPCLGRARRRRLGPSMAAGPRAAAEEIFLLRRPARDACACSPARTATTGRSRASSGCASPPSSRARSRRRCSIRWRRTSSSAPTTPSTIAAHCRSDLADLSRLRRQPQRVPALGRPICAGRGHLRAAARLGPRHQAGLERRQRDLLQHRHVHGNAGRALYPARGGAEPQIHRATRTRPSR